MLVEGRELDERYIDFAALPVVVADNHLMYGEKQVVILLLPLERKLLQWDHRHSAPSICVIPVVSTGNVSFSMALNF